MTQAKVARRTFLARAGQGLAGLPLLSAMPATMEAEAKTKEHKAQAVSSGFPGPKVHLNVRDFGAMGDGSTKDTKAIQMTLDRCSVLGGGEVLVPAGQYLTGALAIRANTMLRLAEGASLNGSPDLNDYPVTDVRWEGHWIKGYIGFISAQDSENIGISGPGRIVATPTIRGRVDRASGMRYPALLEFVNCRNVMVENCYTAQSGMWSIHPVYCENVSFRNVVVHSGADGIDVDSCRHVTIDGCDFATADDCISLKSGRGEEGNTIGVPTEDVTITNCTFRDQHWACIGIGSETSAGIRNVHVSHCKCLGARTFAIYIKSRPGRGAFIEDISMTDLEVSGAKMGFLRFNILNSGKKDANPVPGLAGIPTIRNFNFSNIRVTDMPTLVDGVAIHPDKPLEGFTLTNVTGTCGKGIFLANIKNAVLRDIQVTGYSGALLNTHNVTGKGLQGAVPVEPPPVTEPAPEPATPYVLK